MFTPARMKKMDVLLLEKDLHNVAEALGEMGIVHFVEARHDEQGMLLRKPAAADQLQNCTLLLEKAATLSRRLSVEMPEEPGKLPCLPIESIAARLDTIAAAAQAAIKQEDELNREIDSLSDTISQISVFRQLNLPVEQIPSFSFLHFATGRIDEDELSGFRQEAGPDVVTVPLSRDEGEANIVAITSKKGRWAMQSALEKSGFRPENLSEKYEGIPREIHNHAIKRRDMLLFRKEEVVQQLKEAGGKYAEELNWYRRRLRIEQRILQAEENFGRTSSTYVISGWVPENKADALRVQLHEITSGRMVIQLSDPEHREANDVPVLLRHGKVLRPFELLVSTYGVPGYLEIEPTIFVALSFVPMFGLMFGDVGQGAVLLLLGIAAVFSRLPKTFRNMGAIIALCGAAAMVGGLLFGAVFGSEHVIKPLLFNPLQGSNSLALLTWCVVFGMAMNSLGLVVNVINGIRRRDYADAIVEKYGVVGIIFYWGALWLALKALVLHWPITVPELLGLLALPSLVVFLREPIARRIFGKPAHGGIEAYIENGMGVFEMLIGFLSNTFSFVRVGAFALAHAGLSLATYILADTVKTAPAGQSLSIGIIVLGNIFIIVFEGLIVSIQCLRLEYYEFFGKFYRGEGKPFAPFTLGN